jgi:hypothetical protein
MWSTPRPGRFFPWDEEQVSIVQEAGWDAGPVWTVAPTGACMPGPSGPRRVAVPTELPRPMDSEVFCKVAGSRFITQLLTCRRELYLDR